MVTKNVIECLDSSYKQKRKAWIAPNPTLSPRAGDSMGYPHPRRAKKEQIPRGRSPRDDKLTVGGLGMTNIGGARVPHFVRDDKKEVDGYSRRR
jgi:hypothetical protein